MLTEWRTSLQQWTPTLAALWAMSVLALGVGLERWVHVSRARRRLAHARRAIATHWGAQSATPDAKAAQAVNASLPMHPASALLGRLLVGPTATRGWRRAQQQVVRQARRRLWVLGSIGTVAPFVGLMGTVIGIMEAFRALGVHNSGGFGVVSQGISEALVTTAAGIFVAVEAVLLFNYLQVCAGAYAAELSETCEELAERQEGGAGAGA